MADRYRWLSGSPRRAFCVLGVGLIVAVFVTNVVNDASTHHHHRFGQGVRVALGGVVLIGLALILVAIVWTVVRMPRRGRSQ
jgi:multisubunit Na+/H+ antiporter MnhB subunit